MSDTDLTSFTKAMQTGYAFEGNTITLGGAMLEGKAVPETPVRIPLKMMNRHGLDRVAPIGLRLSGLPHHRTCGFLASGG